MSSNKKISELNALSSADNADLIPIVDVSASETKKITKENLLEEITTDLQNHLDDHDDPHQTLAKIRENVEPVEAADGERTSFTIPEAVVEGSLKVFADTARMREGPTRDYTVSYGESTTTVIFTLAPMQWVMFDYRIA
jgi:hypothetical protein